MCHTGLVVEVVSLRAEARRRSPQRAVDTHTTTDGEASGTSSRLLCDMRAERLRRAGGSACSRTHPLPSDPSLAPVSRVHQWQDRLGAKRPPRQNTEQTEPVAVLEADEVRRAGGE
jgi:hypothetical protein